MYRCRKGRNPIDLLPTVPTIGTLDTLSMLSGFLGGNKMAYRLALDIGTASCGLVAVGLDSKGEPIDVVHHALHIFPEPLLPPKAGGVGEPKKAAKRAARMARRIIDRRGRRLKRLARLAGLLGLDRKSVRPDSGQQLHALRAKAAMDRIELDDLLRVLLKLAKRRGYAGGFKARNRDDKDHGEVEPGINKLKELMRATGCDTLGQYLHKRFQAGEVLRLKEAEPKLYAHREMLIAEFDRIWNQQARHHPVLNAVRPDPVLGGERSLREQFFNAIFYQRPLKSVAPMVGNCPLEPSLPRAPMAQPAMQAFRIEKQLADLRWGMGRNALPLSREQRDAVRDLLNNPAQINKDGKVKFEKIYKALESVPKLPGQRDSLNMERSSRDDLMGNRTLRAFKDLGVLKSWLELDRLTQLRIINFLADLGSPEQVDQRDWHTRFTRTEWRANPKTGKREPHQVRRELDSRLVSFINQLVETGKFGRLSEMGLPTGRASYSVRALERLTQLMRTNHVDEHDAVQQCYPPAAPTGELLMKLPPHKPTGNVVVDVALNAVRRAVNEALSCLGAPPAEVVVELSRDMALGIKARGDIEKKIDRNRREREKARKDLVDHEQLATDGNVLRYLLWKQQDTHCPYCGDRLSLEQAIDGSQTNREHILPRTLTRVGRQRNHLVLAHRSCNDLKRDRTPFEAFHTDEARWKAVMFCVSILSLKKQFQKSRLLALQDYEHEVLDDDSISEFSERQYAETSWIGKLTAQWLRDISPRVSVSRGTMTAYLRRIWKLETVIPQVRIEAALPVLDRDGKKISSDDFALYKPYWEGHTGSNHPRTDRKIEKRIDHRHHLIDALVIAQTSVSLYQRMARHYKELAERRMSGEAVRLKLEAAPPISGLRDKALALARSAEIRHKPDRHVSGAFFQDTAYRKVFDDDGKSRLAIRISISQLADAAGSIEKARRRISGIVSPSTRKIVSDVFESRVAAGKTVKEALAEPIRDQRYNTTLQPPIRKVSVYQRVGRGLVDGSSAYRIEHGSSAYRIEHGPLYKHYLSDGYAYVVLVREGGRLVRADSVSTYAANRPASKPRSGEIRFFRGDTLRDPKTGKRYLIHQILANATVRAAEVTEARSWIELGTESGGIQFGEKALAALERLQRDC